MTKATKVEDQWSQWADEWNMNISGVWDAGVKRDKDEEVGGRWVWRSEGTDFKAHTSCRFELLEPPTHDPNPFKQHHRTISDSFCIKYRETDPDS